ncbi:MAG TPA: molybdopterin-dependent oxidoreductase, partial [Acidobacteriaceae bacterium]|nr:molybdopterin-dependent oxidoreductase [Acidobacteriaceae bacterium]
FANHPARLSKPLLRGVDGQLKEVSWEEALEHTGNRLREIRESRGGESIGVIGSNRTTNEENYLLQKFARTVLGTNNIDHHRTADYVSFVRALAGHGDRAASLRDAASAPAVLLLGNDPTEQHPALAWNLRTNVRLNKARLFVVNHKKIKLVRQARSVLAIPQEGYGAAVEFLAGNDSALTGSQDLEHARKFRDALRAEPNLLIVFGSEYRGGDIASLVKFGLGLPNAKFACLGDYANSRGAADMGLFPDLLPGYLPVGEAGAFTEEYGGLAPQKPGKDLIEMFDAAGRGELAALYVVGSNPIARYGVEREALKNTFLVVQDMFLTETALGADVVLPAANLYEKSGTVTNTYGDQQLVSKAGDFPGVRTDFELIVRIAAKMGADPRKLVPFGRGVRADMGQSRGAQSGEADRHAVWLVAQNLEPRLSPFDPFAILDEIQRLVPGYAASRLNLMSAQDVHLQPNLVQITSSPRRDLVLPSDDTLFTSGTLGRYSAKLHAVMESREVRTSETAAD